MSYSPTRRARSLGQTPPAPPASNAPSFGTAMLMIGALLFCANMYIRDRTP